MGRILFVENYNKWCIS